MTLRIKKASFLKAILSGVLLFQLSASTASAQSCLVSSLRVSTGFNPVTTGMTTAGSPDPMWDINFLSPANAAVPGAYLATSDARVITPDASKVTAATCRWLSFINANNYPTNPSNTYHADYIRKFQSCVKDSFRFKVKIGCDDRIREIWIDGTVVYAGQPPAPNMANFIAWTNVNTTISLPPGGHTIVVKTMNYPWPKTTTNFYGFALDGNLTSIAGIGSLVSESSACKDYVCKTPIDTVVVTDSGKCDDICYWRVTGNNIHSGNNLFGTLSNDDIRIISSNTQRAVIKAGGNIGINQTAPNTTFDVNCLPPASAPSGLQFENLPQGHGNALVVDANGYVYTTQSILYRQSDIDGLLDELKELRALKQEMAELKAQINRNTNNSVISSTNTLVISPNPSNGDITANYSIGNKFQKGVIRITDEMGNEVASKSVEGNDGNVHFSLPSYTKSTVLIVSLIVDGNTTTYQRATLMAK